MGYQSWKIAQLKAAAMEGNGSAYDEEILMKNWNVDKMRAATILRVMIKSKAAGMLRVGVMCLVCARFVPTPKANLMCWWE